MKENIREGVLAIGIIMLGTLLYASVKRNFEQQRQLQDCKLTMKCMDALSEPKRK